MFSGSKQVRGFDYSDELACCCCCFCCLFLFVVVERCCHSCRVIAGVAFVAGLTDVDVAVVVSESSTYFFQLSIRIPPGKKEFLQYNLYPLVAGYVALPRLHLQLDPDTAPIDLDSVVDEMLPAYIFVMPHGKGAKSPS